MKGKWIYYDPDFSREPRVKDPTKFYCETCFRIVNTATAIRVDTSHDFKPSSPEWFAEGVPYELTARKNSEGEHFIGQDCWRRITREYNFED